MRECAHCGGPLERSFRFCPWCATPQRLKIVDFFRADPRIEQDLGKALRVSRYLDPERRHVRFSVWDESGELVRAEAAVSLDEDEAARLGRFLAETAAPATEEPADSTIH